MRCSVSASASARRCLWTRLPRMPPRRPTNSSRRPAGNRRAPRRDGARRLRNDQAIETIAEHCDPQGPIVVEAHFDEFNLDARSPIKAPRSSRPTGGLRPRHHRDRRRNPQLAGFDLRRNADRIRTSVKDGATVLEFHFEHRCTTSPVGFVRPNANPVGFVLPKRNPLLLWPLGLFGQNFPLMMSNSPVRTTHFRSRDALAPGV